LPRGTGIINGRRTVNALRIAVPAMLACVFTWRAAGGLPPELRFSDDFFYYVIPSMNWVQGHGSTFFPGEFTNGYHPLWFVWIALLHVVAGNGFLFFAFVDLSILALIVGFFFVFERVLRSVTGGELAAAVGAAVATAVLLPLSTAGVETALTAFAAAVLLWLLLRTPLSAMTVRDAGLAGLAGAVMVLSRLDSVVLLILVVAIAVVRFDWRQRAALLLGAAPIPVYLAMNVAVSGHLATTSMAAKTLGVYWPPNLWFVSHPSLAVGIVTVTALVAAVAAIAWLTRRDDRADVRRICLALGSVSLFQILAQALTSGWVLFPWYFWSLCLVLGLVAALVTEHVGAGGRRRAVGIPAGVAVLLLGVRLVLGSFTPDQWQVDIAAAAGRLHAFAEDHPGVYAMGDAAGTPAYAMGQPVVHLEGLMMSADFLTRIREEQPLHRVLLDYGVDYYVTVREDDAPGGCVEVTEPSVEQSSPRAPHLAMTICANPVLAFDEGTDYRVRVYRIDRATGRAVDDEAP
jgi:hypothetical protein